MSLRDRWPVVIDPIFGCALWQGRRDSRDGRAIVWRGKTPVAAARVVYEAEVGEIGKAEPIANGASLELDHLCRRPDCVAPHHLEPVTRSENEKRKSWSYRAKRTTCPKGHDLHLNAATTPEGGRTCRKCNNEAKGIKT